MSPHAVWPMRIVSWVQLGLRYGGLGLRSLALHTCAAYIASISSSGFSDIGNQHLLHAVNTFYGLVPVPGMLCEVQSRTCGKTFHNCHIKHL